MLKALVAAFVIPLGLDLYLPFPEANPPTVEKVEFGRRLFNDKRLSRDGTVACATCHEADRAFSEAQIVSTGVFGRRGSRNSPALINRGYGSQFFWDGRAKTLEEQVLQPIEDPNEMDLPVAEAAERVGATPEQLAQALASYVRSILSGDAPYDRFIAGVADALTEQQKSGLHIFRTRGNCAACHVGPTFSDERLHNTGIAWRDGALSDPGGGNGTFKTPALREVARTAPYMHDGSLATLADVVDFYNRGGHANPGLDPAIRPLGLTPIEKRDLEAFLHSLTGRVTDGR